MTRRSAARSLVVLPALLLVYGTVLPAADPASPEVVRRLGRRLRAVVLRPEIRAVSPELTDPAITAWLDDHLVCYDSGAEPHDRLFLFLAGSGGLPDQYNTLCREAALAGLHAINLSYTNDRAVEWEICRQSDEENCLGKVRLEMLEGKDYSREIEIDRADSIENRLIRLLRYLDRYFPDEGWGRYLTDGGDLFWERIVAAGHSQGGGHALMIGTQRWVARVAMFAWVDFHRGELAEWITPDTKTPMDRIYAFRHLEDRIDNTRQMWRRLGLYQFGPEVDVDESEPPYSNTHLLVSSMDTSLAPSQDGPPWLGHLLIITDQHTPVDEDGQPLFADVWRYMMGAFD